jgi:DNA-binding protein WhiA
MYTVAVLDYDAARKMLQSTKLLDAYGEVSENLSIRDNLIIQKECCKRAFIRGAFLASGSISDPEKFYHFEIVCASYEKALQLQKMITSFEIEAKIVERKRHYVVYIKEGAGIVDILNVMEAHVALMEFENIRIVKEMRNSVNRKVNCETANLKKTVSAAVKQLEDIQYIRDTVGLETLSESLEAIAKVRLENPDASLKELGTLLTPAVGKSGVNHRLRKLSEIADGLRETRP